MTHVYRNVMADKPALEIIQHLTDGIPAEIESARRMRPLSKDEKRDLKELFAIILNPGNRV